MLSRKTKQTGENVKQQKRLSLLSVALFFLFYYMQMFIFVPFVTLDKHAKTVFSLFSMGIILQMYF